MTTTPDQSRTLDAAYRPFPTFDEWKARTDVEGARWSALVQKLREAKEAAATITSRALDVAKRAAAFDTGAIENLYETDRGFTYSVAFQTGAWELGLLERGEQVRPLFEAQMQAYDFVLDLATGSEPVSEAAIRRLHEVICAAQDTYQVHTSIGPQNQPLPKGVYKALPNHVRTRTGEDHSYAPVDMTPAEMHRFVQELRSEAFLAAHPIQQAAYAHYCFVAIHPFADGNGRVARALASLYTYRAASVPIIILSEDKPRYLDALAAADDGKEQRFLSFMQQQSIATLQLVVDDLHSAGEPTYEASVQRLKSINVSSPRVSPDEVDRIGLELAHAFGAELNRLSSVEDGFQVRVSIEERPSDVSRASALRVLQNGTLVVVHVVLDASPPRIGQVFEAFQLLLPRDFEKGDDLLLLSNSGSAVSFPVEDFATSHALASLRLRKKAEEVLVQLLQKLADTAEANAKP